MNGCILHHVVSVVYRSGYVFAEGFGCLANYKHEILQQALILKNPLQSNSMDMLSIFVARDLGNSCCWYAGRWREGEGEVWIMNSWSRVFNVNFHSIMRTWTRTCTNIIEQLSEAILETTDCFSGCETTNFILHERAEISFSTDQIFLPHLEVGTSQFGKSMLSRQHKIDD